MFYDLICLTWLDTISVVGTFLSIVLIQLFNSSLDIEKNKTTTAAATTTTIIPTNVATLRKISTTTNGQLKKQKSEFQDDSITSTTTPTIEIPTTPQTPTATLQRHSLSSINNCSHNNLISQPSLNSSESLLSDEYHEDEDTLSLDNLFPCDQTEINASKKISFIIDELIQTEINYVNNLRKGLKNYGNLKEKYDLPEALKGKEKQQQLLGNINEILQLHEEKILPLMLRNQRDLKTLFDEFAAHFDKDQFYPYVIFMMNKKTSMQLRQEQREWFQNYQNEIKDKLGVDSFLVQPIQRLTRYPLLLQQFISEFYKSGISCKPVLMSVCKLETRMRRILELVNHAEEIPSIEDIHELKIFKQGHFRRSTEFDVYNYRSRKKYHGKILVFDRCLACIEMRKKRLTYRQLLPWDTIELKLNNSKSITILQKPPPTTNNETTTENDAQTEEKITIGNITIPTGREELELSANEAITVTQWLRTARRIIEIAKIEAAQYARFSLPMDLILGVALAVWLIWKYLY